MTIKKQFILLILCIISIMILAGCAITQNEKYGGQVSTNEEEIFEIRFSNLVELSTLEKYNGKRVRAIGYLSPITSYDGSFLYLMNLPYQTCPYCMPSEGKITNTISVFAREGSKMEYNESAVVVTGTLKLEEYTDSYGYTYNYRLVDCDVAIADTSKLGGKIDLYNKLAEKNIFSNILTVLTAVDDNVYHDIYAKNYNATYDYYTYDYEPLVTAINDLKEMNDENLADLLEIAEQLEPIAKSVNEYVASKDYASLEQYLTPVDDIYVFINSYMNELQL